MLQTKDARLNHIAGHWVSAMKKYWRYDASDLYLLFCEHFQSCSSDIEPCLQPDIGMSYNSGDDKASAAVGRHLPVSATAKQSTRIPVGVGGDAPKAADHDFCCERVIPTVIHRMNISRDPGESLYSGRPDGNGHTYISMHDETLDPIIRRG